MKTKTYRKIEIPDLNFDKFKIVLIGISKFPEDNQIIDVPNIKLNIDVLERLFTDKSFFGVDSDNILVLLNENKVSIEKQLSSFAKDTEPDETLLVYFSGHGFVSSDDLSIYLSTVDSTSSDVISTGISVQRFRNLISNAYAKRKIFILDACFSGAIHRTVSDSASFYSNKFGKYDGEFIISSSSESEQSMYSDTNPNEPTYFTNELINVLINGLDNGNPYLTLNNVFDNVIDSMLEKNFPIPQKTIIGNIGNLPFALNNKFDGDVGDYYKNVFIKNILNKVNKSNAFLPSFKYSTNNFVVNIALSITIVIIFALIYVFYDINNNNIAINAQRSNVKIEHVRQYMPNNYVHLKDNNSINSNNRTEVLMKKVKTFLRADSGSDAAILYLKKILIIDPNNNEAKTLLDSLTNGAD